MAPFVAGSGQSDLIISNPAFSEQILSHRSLLAPPPVAIARWAVWLGNSLAVNVFSVSAVDSISA